MRKQVKQLLATLEESAPRVKESMLAALTNVRATHLFDRDLWQKLGLRHEPARGDAFENGIDAPPQHAGKSRALRIVP